MSRKVLISFLGTGNYFPVYYTWKDNNGKESRVTNEPTRFVQEAIVTKLCRSWTKDDCIMVFRTTGSNDANWVDRTITKEDGTTTTIRGLKSTLENIRFQNGERLRCPINPDIDSNDSYIIPMGLEANELDTIFQCVFAKLNEGDEIYFDVTHAFRTIPLFATTLFNYARFLKGTAVKGIYYGAFEKLGPVYLLTQLPDEKKKELSAPIADLTNIVRLQEINTAASNFRDFGNLSAFSKLILGEGDPDEDIKNISGALEDLDTYIQTCQLDAIEEGDYIATIESSIQNFCDSVFTTEAQRTLLKKISSQLNDYGFTPDCGYQNIEAAIDWAIDYRMIQQAYTMVREYIITRVYDLMDELNVIDSFAKELLDEKDRSKDYNAEKDKTKVYKLREKIAGLVCKSTDVMKNSRTARNIWNSIPWISYISPYFIKIKDQRNNLNHASLDNANTNDLIESLKKDWKTCRNELD